MKKLLILLFSILISFNSYGLFEKTVCVETDAQIRNDLYYLPNETKPFSGKNLCEYENGQIKHEGNYKDGKQDGKWTWWNMKGQKDEVRNYKDGDLVDKTIFKYSYLTGQITEQSYKDGKKDGKWTKWYKNGEKKYEKNYKDGNKDGKWTEWHKNGQKKTEKNYKDGVCISGDC